MLVLKFNRNYLTENVNILDPYTIQFRKENASFEDIGKYYCFLNYDEKKTLVCATQVTVGYKPLPVANFSCISWHYQNLTCSWIPQQNPIITKYILEDFIIRYNTREPEIGGVPRPCPEKISETSCQWQLNSDPPYRKASQNITFKLTGINSLGNYSQIFTINHYARVLPSAPHSLDVQAITETSISVVWLPPSEMSIEGDFEPGLTYQLQYKSEYDDIWDFIIVNKTKEAHIIDLNPYTVYTLRLRCRSTVAYTDDMWSNFTTRVIQTKADVPYVAPKIVQGLFEVRNFQRGRNIIIHWKPIPQKDWNGENFHYDIQCYETHIPIRRYKKETNSMWKKEISSSATFTNMNNMLDYVFIIRTANSQGTSDEYSKIIVNNKENLLPPPKDIKVTDYGRGMYEIAWTMPEHVEVDNYTIFWCEAVLSRPFPCVGPFQWKVVSKDSTFARLNLSDIDTNYRFAISANSRLSSSGMEWAPCIIPHNGVLNKIEKVNVQAINSTSLKVIWYFDCDAQKHIIEKYCIYCYVDYNSTHKEFVKRILFNNTQTNSYIVTGLKPYTVYSIVITAMIGERESSQSDYKTERTKAGAPSDSPQNVTITNITDTSVELSFYPPNISNGIITSYNILITSEDGSSKQKSFWFHKHRFSAVIDKLVPYTNYTMEVKACVEHECSPPKVVYVMTDIGVPGIMEPPIPALYNGTFVKLSWTAPQHTNGPIDFYSLNIQWEENDELQNQTLTIYDYTHYNMNVDCPFRDKDVLYSFSIQAANVKNGNVLYGNMSAPTQTKLCYISDGVTWYMLLGIIVGGTLGLVVLLVLLYGFARWMKKKVDRIKEIKVQLPPGLDSPPCHSLISYENFENGLIRKASESNLSPQTLYGPLSSYASDEGDPKDPPDSDASQFSNNSTEELLYKKNGQTEHGGGHSNGESNTGKGHDSISSSLTNRTQLSSDSGAETDVLPPPSPESDNGQGLPHSSPQPQNKSMLPKVDEAHSSDSKDSGLEKEEGGNEKENSSNHYSRFVCYLDNPQHPYNQRKILDRSSGSQQLPYSKFGVNMPGVSGYIPLANSLVFMSRSLANSEPSVVDAEKIKEKDQEITTDVAPPYSKYGLARSFGEALNMPASVDICTLNNGYSKCGVASNIPCLQNTHDIPTNLPTPVSVPNSSYQKANKSTENIKSLPLSSWVPCPKNNGYVTVDKLTNPGKTLPTQPVDGTAYSRLGTKPEVGISTCQSKGYVSIQDAKDMLSGKEKSNGNESKEHLVGIPGYSKFDIQCDRLDNSSNIETMDPILTGTKPKIYPNNVRQDYVPYCGFNDSADDYMYNKNPNFEDKGQNLNNSLFPVEEDNGNITPNLSLAKYLAQPKLYEPKNGYVQINPEISPDSVKIVPSDSHVHSSLTDTAV
ncbi:uncharacterized protein LOC111627061 [Centruroides sculpturatus]|uniref:uncharacterized protein LOC111627061 n=1 Tax=Centruroides sculpturatus TaxID=218467 RepID=UPI000C6E4428|nr:uncharacterized protein LOC111627061 [Centruroides sculpturatus]